MLIFVTRCLQQPTSALSSEDAYTPTRLHAFMQHTDNFDQARRDRAIVEDVHRPSHLCLRIVHARVPDIETEDALRKFGGMSPMRA
jgi:hypothetical protein